MLNSVLERRRVVGEILQHFDYIIKVYADSDFDFSHMNVNFYILLRHSIDTPRLLDYLYDVYKTGVRIYVTYEELDIMFRGKKVIWRNGEFQGDLLP